MYGTQSILIDRASSESRKEGFQTIVKRANSAYQDSRFKPVILFPEGTTTNGTALVQFKVGAFAAGVPVQPVCLRYPNRFCDLTWPPNISIVTTVFHMACQFVNFMEADFLPPYIPSEEEKQNPQQYADNVRTVMANHLHIPTTEHSYDDCKLMFEAQKLKLPESSVIPLQMEPIGKLFNLKVDEAKSILREFVKHDKSRRGMLTPDEFAQLMKLPTDHAIVQEMFELMDQDEDGMVSFKEYIIGLATMRAKSHEDIIQQSFQIFDADQNGNISKEEFEIIMSTVFPGITNNMINYFFTEMDTQKKGAVSYEEFSKYAKVNPQYIKIAEKLMQKKKEKGKTVPISVDENVPLSEEIV